MGLSRNKVAVSEGAAGSPPFYGEHGRFSRIYRIRVDLKKRREDRARTAKDFLNRCSIFSDRKETEYPLKNGGVAQLGEHLPCKQGVMGSIPIISTKKRKLLKARETRNTVNHIGA